MSTLHTVNRSPFEKSSLATCLRLARPGSSVLLFEDGVYAAVERTDVAEQVREAAARLGIYVLGPDLVARGLSRAEVIDGVSVVDYGGFVDLSVAHERVQAWL